MQTVLTQKIRILRRPVLGQSFAAMASVARHAPIVYLHPVQDHLAKWGRVLVRIKLQIASIIFVMVVIFLHLIRLVMRSAKVRNTLEEPSFQMISYCKESKGKPLP
jgi:hypothetical protein